MSIKSSSILNLHNMELTPHYIAEELGVSISTVYTVLKENGLTPHKKIKQISSIEIINAYNKEITLNPDLSVTEFAEKHSTPASRVYRILAAAGIATPKRNLSAQVKKAQILELAADLYQNSTLTVHEICAQTGVRQPVLNAYISRMKILPRNYIARISIQEEKNAAPAPVQ